MGGGPRLCRRVGRLLHRAGRQRTDGRLIHLLLFAHGHLHLNNVLIDKQGKLAVIDFSDLQRQPAQRIWKQSPETICKFFALDFSMVYSTLRELGMPREKAVGSILGMMDRYPITEKKKKSLKQDYTQIFAILESLRL